ncbi:uncharacterized protein LOC121970251 [Zingiber officinale]|uniref:uncharacterized protein LOC121970251 n=1 Tax=Zingiber officinale TaxID=94328 RepID=UPI001C4BF6C6|nr:uncharacterized protein LOC121970251 [Zingiber officinale]XP_042376773.1 uncharacterized protein LOC121970251 [Zingiber officinale]
MRRQAQYTDSGINPMITAQMQQRLSEQRLLHNSGARNYPGGSSSFQPGEERQHMYSKAEGQWQWDRDGIKSGLNQLPSQMYKEGQVTDISHTLFEEQVSDSKLGMEMLASKDPRAQARQDELETRFDSNFPQTFEGLEQKFFNDIISLSKEQQQAEDRENARHRERLDEISAKYQEKLLAVRVRQATHREEFLQKESQVRHQQYQQANVNSYQSNTYQSNAGAREARGFGSPANAISAFGDAHGYVSGHYDSFGERAEFSGGRGRGYGGRGHYPGGRAYNSRG